MIAASAVAEPAPITYVYPDQSVWTTRLDAKGEPDNPLLRLAETIFDKAGIPWSAASLPAARMFGYLAEGQANFSMLVKAPQLETCCLIGKDAMAGTELRVYRLAGSPPVAKKEDLIGKSVIGVHGYSYGPLKAFLSDPANSIALHEAKKHQDAFLMLEAGRAQYLLDYAGPAAEVLAALPIEGIRYEVLSKLDVYLVLSRRYPDAEKTLERLEAIARSLDKPGILGLRY